MLNIPGFYFSLSGCFCFSFTFMYESGRLRKRACPSEMWVGLRRKQGGSRARAGACGRWSRGLPRMGSPRVRFPPDEAVSFLLTVPCVLFTLNPVGPAWGVTAGAGILCIFHIGLLNQIWYEVFCSLKKPGSWQQSCAPSCGVLPYRPGLPGPRLSLLRCHLLLPAASSPGSVPAQGSAVFPSSSPSLSCVLAFPRFPQNLHRAFWSLIFGTCYFKEPVYQ